MPIVYITHDDGAKNLSPALKFGELRAIVTRNWPLYGNSEDHKAKIEKTLYNFDPGNDYLLLVGDPLNIAWAVAYLHARNTGFMCLKWDRQEKMYITVSL